MDDIAKLAVRLGLAASKDQVPESYATADADQDHIDRKAHTFEVEHVDLSWIRYLSLPDRPAPFANATEPVVMPRDDDEGEYA